MRVALFTRLPFVVAGLGLAVDDRYYGEGVYFPFPRLEEDYYCGLVVLTEKPILSKVYGSRPPLSLAYDALSPEKRVSAVVEYLESAGIKVEVERDGDEYRFKLYREGEDKTSSGCVVSSVFWPSTSQRGAVEEFVKSVVRCGDSCMSFHARDKGIRVRFVGGECLCRDTLEGAVEDLFRFVVLEDVSDLEWRVLSRCEGLVDFVFDRLEDVGYSCERRSKQAYVEKCLWRE